jgi:DNA-binding CsgD family transcriptional regulator
VTRSLELVGRRRELAQLRQALDAAAGGAGGLVLLAGEAGVGKTRLAVEAMSAGGARALFGEALPGAVAPYGPVVAALRDFRRAEPDGLEKCGPLLPHLALLMAELGPPARRPDRALLLEALAAAFAAIGRRAPAAVLLDDLHWADETTLADVLPVLARVLEGERVLLLGAYRSDEVPRGHALRGLRRDLRRAGRLRELSLSPLDETETATLVRQTLGPAGRPSPALSSLVFDRTQGVPFLVEELTAALVAGGRLRRGRRGFELLGPGEVPLPDSVRETVLLRLEGLSEPARALLEAAGVAGPAFAVELVVEPGREEAFQELVDCGLLAEADDGTARFRHALTREAVYTNTPWTRRRALHAELAARLEERRAPPAVVADHWQAAHEPARACAALLKAVRAATRVHAHRNALQAGRRAAELWPEGLDEDGHLALLECLGTSALVCGELAEAAGGWRELAERRRLLGDDGGFAEAQRHLATTYELQGASERALIARRQAGAAFAAGGRPGDAAAEFLSAAATLDSAGQLAAALELVGEARERADEGERVDLRARALGIEGTVRAKLGAIDEALDAVRGALELALEENLDTAAADAYQRVANVLENASDYRSAWDAYQAGFDFCESRDMQAGAQVCLVCLAFILLHTGEWDRALAIDRAILASPQSPVGTRMGAKQHIGLIGAARGEVKRSRRLLNESGAYAARYTRQRMEVWDALGQGWVDELEDRMDVALDRCRLILLRWGESESLHYPVPALRWATSFCATHADGEGAHGCAGALAGLAMNTGNMEARAGLAHALGETALIDGDADSACSHFERGLVVLRGIGLPYEAAQTSLRAGAAFAAAGERSAAVERFGDAYRIARRLRAKPLATRAGAELEALGERADRRLGRRAAERAGGPGLTRRELEVMRLVASGRTNREIARDLFLSTRTVDMHLRNILVKLRARSRTEAAHKATEAGLLK